MAQHDADSSDEDTLLLHDTRRHPASSSHHSCDGAHEVAISIRTRLALLSLLLCCLAQLFRNAKGSRMHGGPFGQLESLDDASPADEEAAALVLRSRAATADLNSTFASPRLHSIGPPISRASLIGCTVCGAPDPGWIKADLRAPHDIYLQTLATAASNARAARRSTSTLPREHLPVGQRVRVQWSDNEVHLGTVYGHRMQRDEINQASGTIRLHTCIAYDINPSRYRPCHDLLNVEFELVDGGIYELSPPPPSAPPHGPPTSLHSCCFDGGSWSRSCSDEPPRTWMAGIRGCNAQNCTRCGVVRMRSGIMDSNCCNVGGSWFGHCGPPERGWAFSWKEGYRICNPGHVIPHREG